MSLRHVVLLGAVASLAGCSGTVSDTVVEVEQKEVPAKAMLEEVAESGELGSAAQEIREALEAMKAAGDSKADELLSDLDALKGMEGKSAAIKKKAAEMAGKL